jgi:hypothetical protein
MQSAAAGKHIRTSNANDLGPPEPALQPVAVGSRALTQHAPGQLTHFGSCCTRGKAQSALQSSQSVAAAAEYGSRNSRFFAPATSTANPGSSSSSKRGVGSASEPLVNQQVRVYPQARPNPSLKLTRYGMQRKPGVRRLRHLRTPGLRCTPPRAA